MEYDSLLSLWNSFSDETIADFIRLLEPSSVNRNLMWHTLYDDTITETGEAFEIRAYELRINEIEKSEVFKALIGFPPFGYFYNWIDRQEKYPEIKSRKGKLNLLQSIFISYATYARRESQTRPDSDVNLIKDRIKKINKYSKLLSKEIDNPLVFSDSAMAHQIIERSKEYVSFLSEYQPERPLRNQKDALEKTFIYDLVRWLDLHSLPIKSALIIDIKTTVDIEFGGDMSHFDKLLRDFEHRIQQEKEKLKKFQHLV